MKAFGSLISLVFLCACSIKTSPKPYVPDFSDMTWEQSFRKAERYEIEFIVERLGEKVEVKAFVGYVKPYISLISDLQGEECHLFFSKEPSFLTWWRRDEGLKEKTWLALQGRDGEWKASKPGAANMHVSYQYEDFKVLDIHVSIETPDGKRISRIFKNDGVIP